jgi:3-phenylpropionate/cinnamic acid dioxygenase small subunit
MAEVTAAVLQRVDELQQRYVRALDDVDMPAWLATFADDPTASYVCISAENESRGLRVALMLDDCRARLLDRVTFITKVWAGTFQRYQMRHLVQRVHCEQEEGVVRVRSNFSIVATPDGGVSTMLAAGSYLDRLLDDGTAMRILERRAIYDTTVLPRYIVYPF